MTIPDLEAGTAGPRETGRPDPRPLRVLALVPYPLGRVAGQRYRIEQWAPYLERHGVALTFASFESEALHDLLSRRGAMAAKALGLAGHVGPRLAWLRRVQEFDAAYLYREAMVIGPAWMERALCARLPVVYDFDDAIWLPRPNPWNPLAPLFKFQGKTRAIVSRSRAVMAGNEYLAAWARARNPHTFVVPSTVDDEGAYAAAKVHRESERPTIGWSGSRTTLPYLAGLRPVLAALARELRYRLLVICDGDPPDWPDVPLEWRAWSSATEVESLLEMDIGLMPQPDDAWSRGKCGMKAIQYMALGIPAVVSRTGALPDIVPENEGGRLVSTDEEWKDALRALARDLPERARLGAGARRAVRERFSARVQAPRVASILRDAAESRGREAGAPQRRP